jgi:pyrimidine-specific ribonucleoside hydrolase
MMAHSGKARFHIIIDTDGGPDDLRAITMMLSNPDFEVIAITTSDGLLRPEESYLKVKSLLKEFGHDGIPVAYGKTINKKESVCHSICNSVIWGAEDNILIPENPKAFDLLKYEMNNEDEKIIFICLGPLTNIAKIVNDEDLKSRIDKVLWYCDDYQNDIGFNLQMDKKSADLVLRSNVLKFIISSKDNSDLVFNHAFLSKIKKLNNVYSNRIVESHKCETLQENLSNGFYKLWDDLLAIYLINPELFTVETMDNETFFVKQKKESTVEIKKTYLNILLSKYSKENKVFKTFPIEPDQFADDLQKEMNEIIARYGLSEWRAGVLTNELHGHLGIYAIIGVKMGIRVRQYFNIGVDEIHITSFGGFQPPISCMNDGLQVGTGATIGHGLIKISDENVNRPEAIFEFKNRKVKLRLKDEYWDLIKKDVQQCIKDNGNLTPEYWLNLRILAIKYWKDFDRMEIFEIIEI